MKKLLLFPTLLFALVLGFLKSGNAAHPLASLQVYQLKRTVFQAGNEQALAFDVHIHVVKTAFDIRQGNRLHESSGCFPLS
jgi:hypothetical protein